MTEQLARCENADTYRPTKRPTCGCAVCAVRWNIAIDRKMAVEHRAVDMYSSMATASFIRWQHLKSQRILAGSRTDKRGE